MLCKNNVWRKRLLKVLRDKTEISYANGIKEAKNLNLRNLREINMHAANFAIDIPLYTAISLFNEHRRLFNPEVDSRDVVKKKLRQFFMRNS